MQRFIKHFKNLILIAGLLSLFACSEGDDYYISNGGETGEVSGTVQKGPFLVGSSIKLYEVDDDLLQTGVGFQTETIDDTGKYTLPTRLSSRYVEVFGQGYYFDEISGYSSSAPLTLSALGDVEEESTINLNILTTLAKPRIRHLIREGYDFQQASEMACASVIKLFGISYEGENSNFTQMQILETGEDNAFLLAASAILMQLAHDAEKGLTPTAVLSETLSLIALDIEEDGQLNDEELTAAIADAKKNLDLTLIRTVMESEYPNAEIPDFESCLPDNGIVSGDISGTVTYNGKGLSGVEMLLQDESSKTRHQFTDENGWYQFTGVSGGTFTLIPVKTGYQFTPAALEIERIASASSAADFEAVATAKVISDLDEFLAATQENQVIDCESVSDLIEAPKGEYLQELVSLSHEYWFSGEASPPTFILCNDYGFGVNLQEDALAVGFHYAPFAGDTYLNQSRMEWTLYNEAGEVIETENGMAVGFYNTEHHFFGIVSPQPFRSVSFRRIDSDSTDGFGNWMFDDVMWSTGVHQDLF